MSYTIIAQLPAKAVGAVWWHIKVRDEFYVVSANDVPFSGPEVMVFPADESGEVKDFGDIVAVRGTLDHKEAIAELLEQLSESDDDEEESNKIGEHEALERFDDFLNECWETVHICGYDYDPARALKMCDEVAYREEFNNWLDSEGLELE